MTRPKNKSNAEKLRDAQESFNKKKAERDACSDKAIKTKEKLDGELDKLVDKMELLEPIKDIPNLSQTCKNKLSEIYTTATTGRKKDIKSKYLEKGLLLEEDAISAYSYLTGEFFKKNKVRKDNGFLNGETDFDPELLDFVADTKTSWDVFTFDAVSAKPINPDYEWQLDGYMWLWGKKKAKLIYVLLDTPKHMVIGEQQRMLFETNLSAEDAEEARKEIEFNHSYGDLSPDRKIKVFETVYVEERIEAIKSQVPLWRDFLNNYGKIGYLLETEEAA